jgi:hypothetical protein
MTGISTHHAVAAVALHADVVAVTFKNFNSLNLPQQQQQQQQPKNADSLEKLEQGSNNELADHQDRVGREQAT